MAVLGWNPRVGLGSFSRGSKEVGCFPVPPKHLLPAQSSQCQGKQILRRAPKLKEEEFASGLSLLTQLWRERRSS